MKFLLVSVFLSCTLVRAARLHKRRDCVLSKNGRESCFGSSSYLATVGRQRDRRRVPSPCKRYDFNCWCVKAVEYTNQVRLRHGKKKMLRVGPISQLNNAIEYANVLGNLGVLQHQILSEVTAKVGCSRFIGAENVAYNFNSDDIAKFCVNQWENSSGHLRNMLSDANDEVVVGIHYARDGRVYCVQTFSSIKLHGTVGKPDQSGCEIVTIAHKPKPHIPTPVVPNVPSIAPKPSRSPTPFPSPSPMSDETADFAQSLPTLENAEPSDDDIFPVDDNDSNNNAPVDDEGNEEDIIDWNDASFFIDFWGMFDEQFHAEPAPKQPSPSPSPSASPSKSAKSKKDRDQYEGNRSCRCIEVGKHCWYSLKEKSGGRCKPFRAARNQPHACKSKCCDYCQQNAKKSVCNNVRVKQVCHL